MWDEVKYEGNLPEGWGDLSGQEESARFWWGASLGVYVGHSEVLLRGGVTDDEQPLWWAKGGDLIGRSPERIGWFRRTWEQFLASRRQSCGELEPSGEVLPPARPGQKQVAFVLNSRWAISISMPMPKQVHAFVQVPMPISGISGARTWT